MSQGPDVRDLALLYAQRGWSVLPVQSGGKVPLISGWPNRATTDSATISHWWGDKFPGAGIGIVTGRPSGLVVLDIDGQRGEGTLRALQEQHGELPQTYAVRTGGGGRHLYFAYPPDQLVRNSAGVLGPGLDIRGDGGFVVAPPSMHQSGNRYQWVMNGKHDLASLPEWLLKVICDQSGLRPASGKGTEKICEGQRNTTLTSLAGAMRRRGMTSESIEAALWAENQARCDPPLAQLEVQRIATSVGRYQPEPEVRTRVASMDEADARVIEIWPEPTPLGGELPPVPTLDPELLPSSLRHLVEDVSERMQAPLE